MNNRIWVAIVIILVAALAIALTAREGADSTRESVKQTQNQSEEVKTDLESSVPQKDDLIRVTSMKNNQVVDGSFTVTGEARGQWYFEGSFPVRIEDANGKVLGRVAAKAKGEWTTTEYVPFEVFVIFDKYQTSTGSIIFEKDNPSGLPENASELRVPIRFE
ncbi:MAG: hypothetical protein IT410_01045 [Candidatus Doudnabacteria bacterium]|nr:hypothetical protein [Candidatus Doudnabacteria bacterium]